MLKHGLIPVLAAGALAASPAYPTLTSASDPVAKESSDFVRFYLGVNDDFAPEGPPFPYDTTEYINQISSTGYFGHSRGEDWCSGQIVFTKLQVPESSSYYFSPGGADNSTSIVRRQNPTESYMLHVASVDEADSQGRRAVNQTDCAEQSATEGLRVETEPFAKLTYDDEEGFGSWYICWVEGNGVGPSLFYRSSKEVTPVGCSEAVLATVRDGGENYGGQYYPYAGAQTETVCYEGQPFFLSDLWKIGDN